jgi:uncharacterized membrane protein
LILLVVVALSPLVCIVLTVQLSRRVDAAERQARLLQEALNRLREGQPGAPPVSAGPTSEMPVEAATPVAATPTAATARAVPSTIAAPKGLPRDDSAPPSTPASNRLDLESFVGSRVLLVAGVITVLFSLGFFLKIAIDRGWVGPEARIAIGVSLGIAALVVGDRLCQRLGTFAHGVMGAGLGALYLSIWFATARFGLIERPTAFGITALVTALGVLLALRRDAPLLAWLGFAGGYLAPGLLGQGEDALPSLTGWLLLLHTGLLAVLWRRPIPSLDLLPLLASVIYFAAWMDHWWQPAHAAAASVCLGALFVVTLLVSLGPALLAKRRVRADSLAFAGFSGLAVVGFGHQLLYQSHRMTLGVAIAVLGVVYAGAAFLHGRRRNEQGADSSTLWAFALASFATALPVLIDGRGLAPAWAFGGLAAVVAGCRLPLPVFIVGGVGLIVLALGRTLLMDLPLHDGPFLALFNGPLIAALAPAIASLLAGRELVRRGAEWVRFPGAALVTLGVWSVTGLLAAEAHLAVHFGDFTDVLATRALALSAQTATLAACAIAIAWRPGRRDERMQHLAFGPLAAALAQTVQLCARTGGEGFTAFAHIGFATELLAVLAAFAVGLATKDQRRSIAMLIGVAGLLIIVTNEIWLWGRWTNVEQGGREQALFAAQMVMSAFWAIYAGTLVVLGFLRHQAGLRWVGLALFALTAGKVFLFDTARLDLAYRVGSFLTLGLLLVAVSYLYNRNTKSAGTTT